MVERGRARAGAEAIDARRRAVAAWLPRGEILPGVREVLWRWLTAEAAPGRLMPWLPVAFGFGVVLYFTAEREPAWWAALALAVVTTIAAFLARARPIAFPLLLGVAAIALGFAVVTLKAVRADHPILRYAAWNV